MPERYLAKHQKKKKNSPGITLKSYRRIGNIIYIYIFFFGNELYFTVFLTVLLPLFFPFFSSFSVLLCYFLKVFLVGGSGKEGEINRRLSQPIPSYPPLRPFTRDPTKEIRFHLFISLHSTVVAISFNQTKRDKKLTSYIK